MGIEVAKPNVDRIWIMKNPSQLEWFSFETEEVKVFKVCMLDCKCFRLTFSNAL